MTDLEVVKNLLYEKNASLIVYYSNGNITEYYKKRIDDLKEILQNDNKSLKNAIIADKIVGKVAASILTVAGVKQIYTDVISKPAIEVLEKNNIKYEYKYKVDYIINQYNTGMCPMENKYKDEQDINKIYNEMIK